MALFEAFATASGNNWLSWGQWLQKETPILILVTAISIRGSWPLSRLSYKEQTAPFKASKMRSQGEALLLLSAVALLATVAWGQVHPYV